MLATFQNIRQLIGNKVKCNLRISQSRLLLDDLWDEVDFEDVVDDTEHSEADDADLHLNKLINKIIHRNTHIHIEQRQQSNEQESMVYLYRTLLLLFLTN